MLGCGVEVGFKVGFKVGTFDSHEEALAGLDHNLLLRLSLMRITNQKSINGGEGGGGGGSRC